MAGGTGKADGMDKADRMRATRTNVERTSSRFARHEAPVHSAKSASSALSASSVFSFVLSVLAALLSPLAAQQLDLSRSRLVDLTHPFNTATLFWPTSPSGFSLERLSYGLTPAGFFYAANAFSMPEHGGTHLDAPIHFGEGKRTLDSIPLQQLIAPAVVIDVSAKAAENWDYRLTPDDVRVFERKHGTIRAGSIVLLRTGWSRHWGDRAAYFGSTKPNDASELHFPSYGAEAARLLVEERKVGALGVDTPSIDYGPSSDFMVHRIAAARNVPGLENLNRLDELPAVGALLIALPMLIEGGSGGPLRAVGIVPTGKR